MWNELTPDELAAMPWLRETESTPLEQKIVQAHFFLGGCDWYAVEYDPKERRFFGYAILNSDFDSAEWGYFSYDELREIRVGGFEIDRDLHWRPQPAREIEKIRRGMRWPIRQPASLRDKATNEQSTRTVPMSAGAWYATQVGRSVEVRERGTDRIIDRMTPLPEWGDAWGWNVTPDGKGVYVRREPDHSAP